MITGRRRSAVCIAGAVLASWVISAVALAKESPPPVGPPRPFRLPTPVTFALPNGLEATLVDFGAVPKATVAVTVRSGRLNEDGKAWIADITADLLKEGAGNKTAGQIAEAAAAMGGQIRVRTENDTT